MKELPEIELDITSTPVGLTGGGDFKVGDVVVKHKSDKVYKVVDVEEKRIFIEHNDIEEPVVNGQVRKATPKEFFTAKKYGKLPEEINLSRNRKLRTKWTVEASQDISAMHNIDAEQELVELLANEVREEMDKAIIGELLK
jgi:hypothetical protein